MAEAYRFLQEPVAGLEDHLQQVTSRWCKGLERAGFDSAIIVAGTEDLYFLDDHGPHFKPNPYFVQWVDPAYIQPGAALHVTASGTVTLFMPQPDDYWHAIADVPDYLPSAIEIKTFATDEGLQHGLQQAVAGTANTAYIGRDQQLQSLGEQNPPGLLSYLDFHRAVKTEYELSLLREASKRGAYGHRAAAERFLAGGTEFEVHMAYLAASSQSDNDLPYGNIVALNEHAAILHYRPQERMHRKEPLSLLIDAGAQIAGYASDITRTHVSEGTEHEAFAALIKAMDAHQLKLIEAIQAGQTFAELHDLMHRSLAEVLADAKLVNCTAEAAYAAGLTRTFCPHGLGHLLGIQVHDAGGHLGDEDGTPAPPAEKYPSLRFTRKIEQNQVFTIEPGLYFIDSLLQEQRAAGADINWPQVEALKPYGGIRIEDNVRVLASGAENLTRDAWPGAAEV